MRILLGAPDSQVVADRGEDEGVGDAQAAKIRNALALYRPLRAAGGVEFRFHRTILYNSIYRADDQVLVNTHLFGVTAASPDRNFRLQVELRTRDWTRYPSRTSSRLLTSDSTRASFTANPIPGPAGAVMVPR